MYGNKTWQIISLAIVLVTVTFSPTAIAGTDSVPAADIARWFTLETIVTDGPASIDRSVINGPPEPPAGAFRPAVEIPDTGTDAETTLNVPAYNWSFGCSATSASMIAAFYDRTSHGDIYTGPTNGGVMPMDNSVWPAWIDTNGDTRFQCPLSATHNGLDGRVTNGHVDDYWDYYNQPGPDPYSGNWAEHTAGDCTGDYMKTNKWFPVQGYNVDGGTIFYNFTNGSPIYAADLESSGDHLYDGGYGLKLFYESRGYTVATMYNQYIYGYNGNILGFTWAQYMAEIDAGRPVMFHVTGHTMVGTGYDTAGQVMYINDTWDYSTHTMTWGGDYSGMTHYAVTIVHLEVATLVELTSFTAKGGADRVRLDWETATELDCAGFHIWRSETKDGNYKRINKELIPAQGGGSWGATYQVTDDRVVAGRTYYYKLEDVNFAGNSTLHGPVSARVRAPGGTSLQSNH
jgi:hypothetical protein